MYLDSKNSLNTIRLLAALQVLYKHSLIHLQIDPIPLLGDFIYFFSGVPIFFTMSGFLIWNSIERSRNWRIYLNKRFWRIYPELWVAVFVELVVVLLLYHEPIDYAQFGLFAITQGTIFQFWTPDCLRGYGCGCPNGSLWTIGIIIQFYILVYFVYRILHGRKVWIWVATIVGSLGIAILIPLIRENLPLIAGKLLGQTILPYFWIFLMASFVAEKSNVILPYLKKYWWIFLVGVLLVRYMGLDYNVSYGLGDTIFLFLCVVGFAYAFPQINIKTDISYGIYIYHMTIVNALIALGYSQTLWSLVVVVIITLGLAWLSTKYIGEFSKKMKGRYFMYPV